MFTLKSISRLLTVLIVVVSMLAFTSPARAATRTVANCNDSGDGSLRQLVLDAQAGDIINFGLDCPASGPIILTGSHISISESITISGAGHDVVISGNNNTHIFNISYNRTITLEYLTLKNGGAVATADGGAIYDNGSFLTLSHMTFENNHASGTGADGGALFHSNNGSLTISNSAFSGNSAEQYGGAIESRVATVITDSTFTNNTAFRGGAFTSYAYIALTLERVTMNGNTAIGPGNTAGQAGAIYFGFGTLNIYNSTISGNGSASYTNFGGAIYTYDSNVTIKNSTIVNNVIDTSDPGFTGGGIEISNATLSTFNTILANNTVDDCHTSGGLTIAQNINNLVEVSSGCGTPSLSSDPNLGALADNGGSTQTHTLLAGSPAIDAGDNSSCLAADQRGISRPLDGNGGATATCDLGAVELKETSEVTITTDTPDPSLAGQAVAVTVTVSGGSTTPTGIVSLSGANTNCNITLAAGTGACNVNFASAGNKVITASYGGDATHLSDTDTEAHIVLQSVTLRSAGAQDGWILESSETSGVGGSVNNAAVTFYLGDNAARKQYRGILSFSTGAGLPDTAVITGVTLKVKKQAIIGGGNPVTMFQGFMVDIKNGFFGAATLQTGDFRAAGKSYGPFNTALTGGWYSIDLTGAKAYVNKLSTGSGLTQIRLRFKLDDNNNTVANYLSLFSGNAPAGSQPQLVITYYAP